jgi:hypothetical protein
MRLSKRGKATLVSVENVTPLGIWLFVQGREYFLSYEDYPYFREQILSAIQNVQLLHGCHLYWPLIWKSIILSIRKSTLCGPVQGRRGQGSPLDERRPGNSPWLGRVGSSVVLAMQKGAEP